MSKAGEHDPEPPSPATGNQLPAVGQASASAPSARRSVAKVSHTLDATLAERLEAFAFYQRVSESSVIEHSLNAFFSLSDDDAILGEQLRRDGAGRRRKS